MTISYFVTGWFERDPAVRLSETKQQALAAAIAALPAIERAEIGVPAEVQTYHGDTGIPPLTLRLDFATLATLERELLDGGGVHRLAASPLWAGLALDRVQQQAMVRRCFLEIPSGSTSGCDYQVHYPGAADDLNTWLRHYLDHHAPVMTTFPAVRGVDVYTRVDWCDALPPSWERVAYMQRNRVAFDTPQELLAALDSPVRERMKADFARFPAFSGGACHYPMRVMRIRRRGN